MFYHVTTNDLIKLIVVERERKVSEIVYHVRMLNDKIWPAMAHAFENTKGDLADRMLAALDAAQLAGGDIRGRQSAALIVVTGKPTGQA